MLGTRLVCAGDKASISTHLSVTEPLVHDLSLFLALLAIFKMLKPASGWSFPSTATSPASSVDVGTVDR